MVRQYSILSEHNKTKCIMKGVLTVVIFIGVFILALGVLNRISAGDHLDNNVSTDAYYVQNKKDSYTKMGWGVGIALVGGIGLLITSARSKS